MSIQNIYDKVLEFDEEGVCEMVKKELEAGGDIHKILNDGLIAPMDEVGKRFSAGDLFIPEMLLAAQAMKGGLGILKPLLGGDGAHTKGTVVIGTVKGDLHDIGKNLVAMMLEGAGFNVVDVGVDVPVEKFVQTARDLKASVVALSALLTTTMPAMKSTVAAIREAGLQARVLVGGAPVTDVYAKEIGADGYSDDAPGAVELAKSFIAMQ